MEFHIENPWISYCQMKEIMVKMGFITAHSVYNDLYDNQLNTIFTSLDIYNKNRIHFNDLKNFLIRIIDTHVESDSKKSIHEEYKQLYLVYQTFHGNPLLISDQKGIKFENYKHHYTNSIQCEASISKLNGQEISCDIIDEAISIKMPQETTPKPKTNLIENPWEINRKTSISFIENRPKDNICFDTGMNGRSISKTSIDVSDLVSKKKGEPILCIEMNLGKTIEVISAYKNDTAKRLATNFSRRHSNYVIL